jgi:hypothetical protein
MGTERSRKKRLDMKLGVYTALAAGMVASVART